MTNSGQNNKPDRRKERLKAALRENLRRRKAQVRGREAVTDSGTSDSPGEKAGSKEPR